MRPTVDKSHWERIYSEKDPSQVSWYEPNPDRSLVVIEETGARSRGADPRRGRRSIGAGWEVARRRLLVDIRSESQRDRDAEIPGAQVVPRNVLEWRLDPSSDNRDPGLARRDTEVILICDQGYQSSLAAATLTEFGLAATDVIGGAQAWIAAGLPVSG